MASSTVSDVAIMARRLGMAWKSFDPGSGSMRAEGNGHIITSTMVRSLGTVLQYSFTSRENAGNCYYIPLREADKLGFGLVEFDHTLFGPNMPGDLDVGSYQGISRTLSFIASGLPMNSSQLGIDTALQKHSSYMKPEKEFISEFNDLVPICSAMLSFTPSTSKDRWLNRIPAPNTYKKGVTSSQEGLAMFESKLRGLVSERLDLASSQSKYILACMERLGGEFGGRWKNEQEWEHWGYRVDDMPDDEAIARSLVIQYHKDMTTFLQNSTVDYRALVCQHALMVIILANEYSHSCMHRSNQSRRMQSMDDYFKDLPGMANKVIESCNYWGGSVTLTVEEVEDAWFSMMFRAFCWQRSHAMIPGVPPLPSEFWNSKMPVYIG